ncbi:aryl-sulfate sulfotransferase [Ekhidna sp.]|uniref:aryl-sulfate sulfotransferase n=1 Tax=Ekhidna sp. TaxID=2608089 RepID=UPI003BA9AA1E
MRKLGVFICLISSLLSYGQDLTVGAVELNEGAYDGLTLFSPAGNTTTYLINNCGQVMNTWESAYSPGASVYLLNDGSIIRAGSKEGARLGEPGVGGIFERINWQGDVVWTWEYSNDTANAHHDFHVMPNGNLLFIAWELKTLEEAVEQGRDPSTLADDELWPDHIVEIEPLPNNDAKIVWLWNSWDHLIQDFDDTKPNYGVVADNPEKIDINYRLTDGPDWLHFNSIHYSEMNDYIILSTPFFNEIWIIDHNTTTAEAKGEKGDILFRWGNPRAYQRGDTVDQKMFFQHTAEWIDDDLDYGGNIIVFNNGRGRMPEEFSSVDIINPFDTDGNFYLNNGVFGPQDLVTSYQRPNPTDIFASFISGAQILSNGNLLIDDGPKGTFWEVDFDDNVHWKYVNPVSTATGIVSQGEVATGNLVFRAKKYASDHPAFSNLTSQTSYIELNPIPLESCEPLSVAEQKPVISIYPNPVENFLSVNGSYTNIRLVDITGSEFDVKYIDNKNQIDLTALESGLYHLIIDKEIFKIIKK